MKKMLVLLLAGLWLLGCAYVEGQPVQEAELIDKVTAHFCETTGFPPENVEALSLQCEYQDTPVYDPAIPEKRWIVGVRFERCGGLLNAAMDYIFTQDGASIVQESSVEDFKARYEAIQRVEPVLEAQQLAEAEKGPFRDWPAQEQQAFTIQYGDISEALSLLQCPRQTQLQYWEIDEIARTALLREGFGAQEVASFKAKYHYAPSAMEWIPTTWEVRFFPGTGENAEAAGKQLAVEIGLNGLDIASCEVYSYDLDGFLEDIEMDSAMEEFAQSFE